MAKASLQRDSERFREKLGRPRAPYKEKLREILLLREKGSYIENNIKNDINQIKAFCINFNHFI